MYTALNANQKGLDITGQNIANVNTQGYTRQELNLSAIPASYGDYQYSEPFSAQVGQGVNVDSVTQTRDSFLDSQYLKQNSADSTLNTSLSALTDLENVFDETNTNGLNATLSDFKSKLQSFSSNVSSVEDANLLRSSAQEVTQVLNQYADEINTIQSQQLSNLSGVVGDTNNILNQINKLNSQISNQKLNGETPNELLDTRHVLLDKLSGYLNITVENETDGSVSIKTGDKTLLDSQNKTVNTMKLDSNTYPVSIESSTDGSIIPISEGQMKGQLQVLNGLGSYAASGQDTYNGIPYYRQSLDDFAKSFSTAFNNLNSEDGITPKPLFIGDNSGNITASNIKIASGWTANPNYITTTKMLPVTLGNNDNILSMVNALNSNVTVTPTFTGTLQDFTTSLMNNIGSDVSVNTELAKESDTLLTSVVNQRESITGVSLDEESINMIKYQKSYSAAARLVTTLDDQLDTLINKMGIVGR